MFELDKYRRHHSLPWTEVAAVTKGRENVSHGSISALMQGFASATERRSLNMSSRESRPMILKVKRKLTVLEIYIYSLFDM